MSQSCLSSQRRPSVFVYAVTDALMTS
uniref:Uncharacterized protein n=1 Tax=Anguilla anguilla TaxID=7936 RepID=A0A0E9T371_ANGAN